MTGFEAFVVFALFMLALPWAALALFMLAAMLER